MTPQVHPWALDRRRGSGWMEAASSRCVGRVRAWAGTLTLGLALAIVPGSVGRAAAPDNEAEALTCWWRTSASAVAVGQPFTLVLTCSVLETDTLTAVVDRGRLDPRAIELPPFEVVGGRTAADLREVDHVFFQYEYTLRLISDSSFARDVPLPDLAIAYRLQTRAGGREGATQGMERRFAMPAQSIRVMSLVPGDAADIRDGTTLTFADVDLLDSRGRLLSTAGLIAMGLAGLLAIVGVGRAVAPRLVRAGPAAGLIGDFTVLRGVTRELASIGRARQDAGWTPDLLARALAAARIVAEQALSRTLAQRLAGARETTPAGAVLVKRWWRPAAAVVVSGSATPKTLADERARRAREEGRPAPRLEALEASIGTLTEAGYGDRAPSGHQALDDTLRTVERIARRLSLERSWPIRHVAGALRRLGLGRDS